MRNFLILKRAAAVLVLTLACAPGQSADLPDYFKPIVGTQTPSAADVGTKNVLQLNKSMFELYGDAAQIFQRNFLNQHPVILGLFSGAGGRFILYRPGQPPLEAPSVPIDYQLMKSVGHSTMALGEIVIPYINSPDDHSWRGSMSSYRAQMQAALDGLDATALQNDWKPNSRAILQNNIDFMDECLKADKITPEAVEAFAKKQGPLLKKNITWAAQTQVHHWMDVIGQWKQMLGADWDKTYAASNTIYVARQNNILFSVLAQYFGPEAINDRLMLIETVSFTATPRGHARIGHAHRRGPLSRCGLLRQLLSDGLRVDGRRRASSHHRRGQEAQHHRQPAAAGLVWVASVADFDHAGDGAKIVGRSALNRERRRWRRSHRGVSVARTGMEQLPRPEAGTHENFAT